MPSPGNDRKKDAGAIDAHPPTYAADAASSQAIAFLIVVDNGAIASSA
jgi:hypothetical protein